MKKILGLILIVITAIFLVSCNKNNYEIPKVKDSDEIKLTRSDYLLKIDQLESIEGAIELGVLQKTTSNFEDIETSLVTETISYVDKAGNAKSKTVLDIKNHLVSYKGETTFYAVEDDHNVYLDIDLAIRIEDESNEINKNIKGNYYLNVKEDADLPEYDITFITNILYMNSFSNLVISGYEGLKFYENSNTFIINFKYSENLSQGYDLFFEEFFRDFSYELFKLSKKDEFEIVLVVKNNRITSFHLNLLNTSDYFDSSTTNHTKLYFKTNAKKPKFPDFSNFNKEFDLKDILFPS